MFDLHHYNTDSTNINNRKFALYSIHYFKFDTTAKNTTEVARARLTSHSPLRLAHVIPRLRDRTLSSSSRLLFTIKNKCSNFHVNRKNKVRYARYGTKWEKQKFTRQWWQGRVEVGDDPKIYYTYMCVLLWRRRRVPSLTRTIWSTSARRLFVYVADVGNLKKKYVHI